ncbi:MAG: hypothetical protein COA35_011340 [Colwellia sp.]|nr:hypothetical protein [Colwellia sp.]
MQTNLKALLQRGEKPLFVFLSIYLIHWVYKNSVFPFYEYMGYTYNSPNIVLFIFFSCSLAFLSFFLPKKINKVSDFFILFAYIHILIPIFTVPLYTIEDYELLLWIPTLVIITCIWLSLFFLARLPTLKGADLLHNKSSLRITVGLSIFFSLIVIASYGVNFTQLFTLSDISKLYDLRMDFRDQNESVNILSKYLFAWSAKVFIPFILIIGVVRKSYTIVFSAIFLQLCIFAVNGQKTILLGLFWVLFIVWTLKKSNSGELLFRVLMLGIITFCLADYLFGYDAFTNIIVRRMFMMPGLLTGYYLEYYSGNGFDYYSNSVLNGITDSIYSTTLAFTIGNQYFSSDLMSANANIFASAFANLGFTSLILEGLILFFLLYLVDSYTKAVDMRIALSLFTLPLMSLADSPLMTSIVTHGIFIALVIAIIINTRKGYNGN